MKKALFAVVISCLLLIGMTLLISVMWSAQNHNSKDNNTSRITNNKTIVTPAPEWVSNKLEECKRKANSTICAYHYDLNDSTYEECECIINGVRFWFNFTDTEARSWRNNE